MIADGNLVDAWDQAKVGLLHHSTQYRPVDYFYVYECFVPIQVCVCASQTPLARTSSICPRFNMAQQTCSGTTCSGPSVAAACASRK